MKNVHVKTHFLSFSKPSRSSFVKAIPTLAALSLTCAIQAQAAIVVGGWDADFSTGSGGLTFSGIGTSASANDTYIFGSTGGTNIAANGGTTITGTGGNAVDVTFRIDLDGSETIIFEQFWLQMQRGGNLDSNIVGSAASFSLDGTTFTESLTVMEVAVGGNGGGDNVGPWDTLTEFRTPDGLGGSIGPQQVYRISGLDAAGALNSGSLWIRYSVGDSSNNSGNLTVINDRIDLTTDAIGLAANNSTASDDGLDVIWTGTVVPEPSSAVLGSLAMLGLLRRRRA
ncbi:PEP-CTERM sorting domain-containing protein (plasmid) [Verrucomicrobiaceae bacterium 227]